MRPALGLVLLSACAAPVRVYVERAHGEPERGVPVLFHDASGEVLGTGATNELGEAEGQLREIGGVSLARSGELWTYVDVAPGDELRLLVPPTPEPVDGTVHVEAEAFPGSISGVDGYEVISGCGQTGDDGVVGGFDVPVDARCLDAQGRVDLLAVAYVDREPRGFAYVLGADPSGEVVLPPWRTDWTVATWTIDGAPEDATETSAIATVRRHGTPFYARGASVPAPFAGGITVALPGGFAEDTVVEVSVGLDLGGRHAVGGRFEVVEGDVPTSSQVHVGELPRPGERFVVHADDVGRPRLAWSEAGAGDVRYAQISYLAGDVNAAWRVFAPGDVTEVRMPALPAGLEALRPTSSPFFGAQDVASLEGLTPSEQVLDWSHLFVYLVRPAEIAALTAGERAGDSFDLP